MFERFTGPARYVVGQARDEARALHHQYIGTEHLLLALLHGESGPASALLADAGITRERVLAGIDALLGKPHEPLGDSDAEALQAIGIDLEAVRAKIEEVFGPGALEPLQPEPPSRRGMLFRRPDFGGPFSGRAKKVIELSLREAIALHHKFIGTEHILLGLLRENGGLAARILADAGVDFAVLRRQAIASLNQAA